MDQQIDGVKINVNKDASDDKSPTVKIKKKTAVRKVEPPASGKKPGNVKKNGGLAAILIVAAIVVAAVGGGVYYWQQKIGEKNVGKVQDEAKSVRLDFEQRLANLKDTITGVEREREELRGASEKLKTAEELLSKAKIDYASGELGFNMIYPARLGQLDIAVAGKEKGQTFAGTFSKTETLVLGGVSVDFEKATTTAASSILFLETGGYIEKNKRYFLRPVGFIAADNYEIKPARIIDAKNAKVLVVDKNSFATVTGGPFVEIGENIGALVNLKNEKFPGLVILNKDLGILPMAEFEAMLKTMEVK